MRRLFWGGFPRFEQVGNPFFELPNLRPDFPDKAVCLLNTAVQFAFLGGDIKFYCVLFYLTLIVLTLYLNGIFHHHYSIIVLIADCTALYLPSFECAAKQVIKYAFPSFSYRTTML